MVTKTHYYIGFIALLIFVASAALYLRISVSSAVKQMQQTAQSTVNQSSVATVSESKNDTILKDKIVMLEAKIVNLAEHIETLNVKFNSDLSPVIDQEHRGVQEYEDPGMAQTNVTVGMPNENIDPFSPEQIALGDQAQNAYISKLQGIFDTEPYDHSWSANTESNSLAILTDMNKFAIFSGTSKQDVDIPLNNLPDVLVTRFNCRSNLCETEFATGSMNDLIAYQNYMIKKMAPSLPLAYFSPVEEVGDKYKMRVFLARNEQELK